MFSKVVDGWGWNLDMTFVWLNDLKKRKKKREKKGLWKGSERSSFKINLSHAPCTTAHTPVHREHRGVFSNNSNNWGLSSFCAVGGNTGNDSNKNIWTFLITHHNFVLSYKQQGRSLSLAPRLVTREKLMMCSHTDYEKHLKAFIRKERLTAESQCRCPVGHFWSLFWANLWRCNKSLGWPVVPVAWSSYCCLLHHSSWESIRDISWKLIWNSTSSALSELIWRGLKGNY